MAEVKDSQVASAELKAKIEAGAKKLHEERLAREALKAAEVKAAKEERVAKLQAKKK